MQSCPLLTIRISGPRGVTAGQAASLLAAIEELWLSMAGGPGEARLQLVEAGTGSIWFRVLAECRKSPVMTFVSFVSAVAAVCGATSSASEPVGDPVGKVYTSFEPKPEDKLRCACESIAKDGGSIELKVEDGDMELAGVGPTFEKSPPDEIMKATTGKSEPYPSDYGAKYGFDLKIEPDDPGERG
jgi:hypothetical protein